LISNLNADLKDFYKWLKNSRALKSCSMDAGEDFQTKPRSDSLVETEDQEAETSYDNQSDKEADKVNQSDQEAESSNSDNQSGQDETESSNSIS